MQKVILKISGMTCASCVKLNENAILAVKGVRSASVRFATNKAMLEFSTKETNLKAIIQAIEKAGYGAKEVGEDGHNHSTLEDQQVAAKKLSSNLPKMLFRSAM
jgi:P-type Cu+ transporter